MSRDRSETGRNSSEQSQIKHKLSRGENSDQTQRRGKGLRIRGGENLGVTPDSLDIADGDFITIMGPSGAGKSTLMGIVGMLDGAWKGEYYLLDNAVHKLDNRRRVELRRNM